MTTTYTDPDTGQQWQWDAASQRWLSAQPPAASPVVYPAKTVSKTRKDTSHLFHLIMTILTGGLWGLFVWLPLTIWHKTGPRKKTVTKPR